MKGTPTWNTWRGMRKRCLCKTHTHYHRYGGRSIAICPEWDSFEKFFEDMGERPEGTTLDRVDNDGNYEPQNCRWATPSEQQSNKTFTEITIGGVTAPVSHWAEQAGISPQLIRQRHKYGWPDDKILSKPKTTRVHSTRPCKSRKQTSATS